MPKITKEQAKLGVVEVLTDLSNYSQERIIELIDDSEETQLQLAALMSASHKDTLAYNLVEKFLFLDQQELYDELFEDIKTAEKLIEYVVEKAK